MSTLIARLSSIQSNLKAPKGQYNSFGKYKYRSCEDILEAVKPLLGGLVLTVTDKIEQYGDLLCVEATASITDGTEFIHAKSCAGIDTKRKGMDVAQCFGSSSSYARKYALNGLFILDDASSDPDATNTHGKAPQKPKQKQAYPSERFAELLPRWRTAVQAGKQTPDSISGKIGSQYTLTPEQQAALGKLAALGAEITVEK